MFTNSTNICLNMQLVAKRMFDVLGALLVIILMFPLLLIVATLIKFSSGSPIFFVQNRVGLNGKIIRVFKFRTMRPFVREQPNSWSVDEEFRVTKIGRILRDYGVDELPQVVNILIGDMSIIGPRPPLSSQIHEFSMLQRKIFSMRPGVLSLAAVNGRRSISLENRRQLHLAYVVNWSLWLDFCILVKSLYIVILRKDVSEYPMN